ncbi:hypothetical protein ACJMK2_037637 [Sinanodonta woodiana]|uniref:F5/8 type C domain-containing protein n=1 Tax=Sinanodonta woodiana TaxID=1069815 RepID=A0ABD3WL32_SINWO
MTRNVLLWASVCLFNVVTLVAPWDPDAGIVKSMTKLSGVQVWATSNNDSAHKVLDNDDNTQWTSNNCLPMDYISRSDQNILYGLCPERCHSNNPQDQDLDKITDGMTITATKINPWTENVRKASFQIILPESTIQVLSIWGIYKDNTKVITVDGSGHETDIRLLNVTDSYHEIRINNLSGVSVLKIESPHDFILKEISALGTKGCAERIVIDLGQVQRIGVVRTRHWAGAKAAVSAKLVMSNDQKVWTTVKELVPDALGAVETVLSPPVEYRYIAVDYEVFSANYRHVYCWEIDAWGEHSKWGPVPTPVPQENTVREILGVNGIWGWGHNIYSDSITAGEGPYLYNQISSHARNYHNLNWDVLDPDFSPRFEQMAKSHGTNATWWLNWDREYSTWQKAGLYVDVSLQFTAKDFPESSWNTPERSAFQYGEEFASHFGQAIGNGFVDAVEVGNEPWDYHSGFYASLLKAMASGIRAVDTNITVLSGAFQAHDENADNPPSGNYIGTRVKEDAIGNVSVLNTHAYSFISTENGQRIATYPENQSSTFNSIRNILRWRDTNCPSKPIWLTEWGWDSDGENEACKNSECVSENAQALYGVRGLLMITRHQIQKATWYFYANLDNCDTLFCRSGLTSSKMHNFTKKAVFQAFETVLQMIGDKYFLNVFKEDSGGYVYLFGQQMNNPDATSNKVKSFEKATHIVAWLPVDAANTTSTSITMDLPRAVNVLNGWRITGATPPKLKATEDITVDGSHMSLNISSRPLIVEIVHPDHAGEIVG